MNFASVVRTLTTARSAEQRVSRYNWETLSQELGNYGHAVMERLLSPGECREIAQLYNDEVHFRSHIHMGRLGFGKGEYRYFKYHYLTRLAVFAWRSIHASPASQMTGTSAWE